MYAITFLITSFFLFGSLSMYIDLKSLQIKIKQTLTTYYFSSLTSPFLWSTKNCGGGKLDDGGPEVPPAAGVVIFIN
jgi:hypothetical protein